MESRIVSVHVLYSPVSSIYAIFRFCSQNLYKCFFFIHRQWSAGIGPTRDAYNIGDNPQFSLTVPAGLGSIWILLTRHITTIDDFRENKEYITVLVYKTNGKRVYYPCKLQTNLSFNFK